MKKLTTAFLLISFGFPFITNAALFFACTPGMDCPATTTPRQPASIVVPTNTTPPIQQIIPTTVQTVTKSPTTQPITITQDKSAQIQTLQKQIVLLLQQLITLLNMQASQTTR